MTLDIIKGTKLSASPKRRTPSRNDQVGRTHNLDLRGHKFADDQQYEPDRLNSDKVMSLVGCDLTGSTVPHSRAEFGPLSARILLLQGTDLTGCDWIQFVGDRHSPGNIAYYDETTVFPAGFTPGESMVRTPKISDRSSETILKVVFLLREPGGGGELSLSLVVVSFFAGLGALFFAAGLILEAFVR